MKPFQKKLIAGLCFIGMLMTALTILMIAENSEDFFFAKIFIFAFTLGVIYWLYINSKESKKAKEKRREKKK